jgi:hypothetical protein
MGRRSDFPRRPHDGYQTIDPKAVAVLLTYIRRDNIRSFAEPCVGKDYRLYHLLGDIGLNCVLASDIIDGVDALTITDFCGADAIITNPPWTRELLHPLIEHFQKHAPTWLLFDSDWAYNQQAGPYLDSCSDIVAVGRLKWFNDTAGKDNASWYRFDKGHSGGPKFHGRGMKMNAPVDVKPAELVEEYIALRDEKKLAEDRFEELLKERYSARMAEIEVTLIDTLNALGIESISGRSGTAYKKITTSVRIADPREFRRHVIGTEQWDLANWSANKTLVNDMVERGEPIPPGIDRSAFYTIGIRRKS